jgi:hypothetical protein
MAAKRVLIFAGAVSLAVWSFILLDIALSYRGGDGSSTWVTRVVFLVVAALATLVVVFAVRRGWRRARARPLPDRGIDGWLVRQPGWRLALAVWVPYGAVVFGTLFGMSMYQHRDLSGATLAAGLASSAITAVGTAAMWRLIWRLQAERSQTGPWSDIAGGSPDRP